MNPSNLDTSSNVNDLQNRIIESTQFFSEIKKFKIEDNFIQKKLDQIFVQEEEFKRFSRDYNLKMNTHADDLITFAESCEGDSISSDELLESLRRLNDDKLNANRIELLNQIETIKKSLDKVVYEINEYNKKITETCTEWFNKINKADQNKDEATSFMKSSVMIAGVGAIVATVAAPFTAGASLAFAIPAKALFTLGASLTFQCTTTAAVSTVVAGVSSIHKNVLSYKLKGVKQQISMLLREMQKGLESINTIIKYCEFNFKKQIAEIEEVEKIVDVVKRLDDKQLIKPIARTISTRARKNSQGYNVCAQAFESKDSILSVF